MHAAPVIFDIEQAGKGFWINKFCMSLMEERNRAEFRADETGYLARFPLTPDQAQALLRREYNRCIELGGNVYFLVKLGATDGVSVQEMCSQMAGIPLEQYRQEMLAGGRFDPTVTGA